VEEMKIKEIDLGASEKCLEMGQTMKDLHLQLPPGRMKAIRMTGILKESNYSGKWEE
jgi:hypothetical protein